MTRGSGSGNKKGGLFGWLFGRRSSAEAPAATGEADPPVTEPPVTEPPVERGAYGTGAAAEPTDAHAGGESEDDDELVLGPAFVAPAAEGGDEPREPGPSDAPGGQEREAEAQPDGSDEGQPEEEALLARLRAAGVEGAVGESALEREYQLPSEEAPAGDGGSAQAAPAPEQDGELDLSRLSGEARTQEARTEEAPIGEERTDGEGELPASDPGPEGREPMEAPVTSRDDKTDPGEDPAGPDTERAGEAASLFLGASASGEADARKDPQTTDETPAETSAETPAETSAETPAETPAETSAETTENAAEGASAEAAGDAAHLTGALSGEAGSEAESETDIEPEAKPETEAASETDPETDSERDPETAPGSEFETRAAAESLAQSLAATAAETPAEPEPAPEQPAAAAAPDVPPDPSAVSEETVRRLIREELEGELGERMSANIRRMIREEVSHALLRQR